MELFLLALLAAAAAADTDSTPAPPAKHLPPPEPDFDEMERKALVFWNYIVNPRGPGERVIPWTEAQEASWLLGRIVCPEGHGDPRHLTYIDDLWFTMSQLQDDGAGSLEAVEDSRNNDPIYPQPVASTLWCYHPAHQGARGSTLPPDVVEMIERPWNTIDPKLRTAICEEFYKTSDPTIAERNARDKLAVDPTFYSDARIRRRLPIDTPRASTVRPKQLKNNRRVQILDVRATPELSGHLAPLSGSIHIPIHQLEAQIPTSGLDPAKPTVVVCKKGLRSDCAVERLQQLGFEDVRSLSGGLQAWYRM